MIYTLYGIHFTINHSLFKRPSQLCSKLYQLSWVKNGNGYMFKTNCSPLGQWYKNLVLVLTNKRRKNSNSQFLITNSYLHQNHQKLAQLRSEIGDSLANFQNTNKMLFVLFTNLFTYCIIKGITGKKFWRWIEKNVVLWGIFSCMNMYINVPWQFKIEISRFVLLDKGYQWMSMYIKMS